MYVDRFGSIKIQTVAVTAKRKNGIIYRNSGMIYTPRTAVHVSRPAKHCPTRLRYKGNVPSATLGKWKPKKITRTVKYAKLHRTATFHHVKTRLIIPREYYLLISNGVDHKN